MMVEDILCIQTLSKLFCSSFGIEPNGQESSSSLQFDEELMEFGDVEMFRYYIVLFQGSAERREG